MTGKIDLREEWDNDREDYRRDLRWLDRIPVDDLRPQTTGIVTDLAMSSDDGAMRGTLRGSQVSRTEDEIRQAWQRKQEMEPCWMCRAFDPHEYTNEQKLFAIQQWLKKAGRWSEQDALEGRLGEIENFAYCKVDKTLTHKDASCVAGWIRRSDL